METKRPLRLLDLPMDVLKEIVKEVPHTNDLTSLALTHSALHRIAVPSIYSRFDIVWPDAHPTPDPRTGVDALTYGLATMVMGEELFGGASALRLANARSSQRPPCQHCGASGPVDDSPEPSEPAVAAPQSLKRRRGNHYSQYTRKFSLGNGPPDWVAEYLITKESGKMLGTLVALAVARMPNLETFIWDMPTGVLRDVWLALSSLGDHGGGQACQLQRVWIRWHNNAQANPSDAAGRSGAGPLGMLPGQLLNIASAVGTMVPPSVHNPPPTAANAGVHGHSLNNVEYPTFSVLPPLKSLSVLDIDELAYLDEMSILIARSQPCLRELRVGIAAHAVLSDWVMCWDGEQLAQVDHDAYWPSLSAIGSKRLGGVLGVLLGRIHDIHAKMTQHQYTSSRCAAGDPATEDVPVVEKSIAPGNGEGDSSVSLGDAESIVTTTSLDHGHETPAMSMPKATVVLPWASAEYSILSSPFLNVTQELGPSSQAQNSPLIGSTLSPTTSALQPLPDLGISPSMVSSGGPNFLTLDPNWPETSGERSETPPREAGLHPVPDTRRPALDGKLQLKVLELERVPLCVPVLQKAFDWSIMTSLVLLSCSNHEQLWKSLKKTFGPRSSASKAAASTRPARLSSAACAPRRSSKLADHQARPSDYRLKLTKIHTDAVSASLISFLKDALAPNTLEVLFLQEGHPYTSTVTIDLIYHGPLRRHRASLKRLMIDSSDRLSANSNRWKRWMFNREVLTFVTSGKMSKLRELGMAVEYKDWHFFLQRLPLMPQLRSLYVPHIADHVYAGNVDPKELALQMVDIVALRPEIELCYVGISTKCFEIMEVKAHEARPSNIGQGTNTTSYDEAATEAVDNDASDLGEEQDDGDGDEHEEGSSEGGLPDDPAETESDMSEVPDETDDDEQDEGEARPHIRLRLREILFYDDKIAIFKARHGRL
ncbi:MAG: hypothetical protein M1832_002371 [Thelocarpon impressellum]|nr:MAG: hypothetical protein M1832_002371 [Thelocarpon impressellum]